MNGFSPAPKEQRLCALKSLIPEAFCEGKIDWEKLKAALGEDINFANERYVLNWAGKSDAFRILQQPSSSTLIPVREESVDFDNTQNIFIEGENLEVLKALQKSYFNKVKMIYIDPPYNTGNDSFIYPDKFSETKEEYLKRVGDKDEAGYMLREGRFAKNSKENGQYHSNWLNMMMPRLYLAKNLLREDGVNRKYICVQLPEKCDEKSEAFKAGYKTIADIAKERIRRAGTRIRSEVEANQAKQSGELGLAGTPEVKMPDLGFKVFRLEDSNFKQWRKTTAATLAEVEQQMLDLVDPVKPDAAVENIVYELLLKSGKDLNSKIVRGNGFYNVNDGELVLLLESASQEIVDSVIALAPAKVIALDRLFHGNDQLKTNTSLQFRDSAIEFLTI